MIVELSVLFGLVGVALIGVMIWDSRTKTDYNRRRSASSARHHARRVQRANRRRAKRLRAWR